MSISIKFIFASIVFEIFGTPWTTGDDAPALTPISGKLKFSSLIFLVSSLTVVDFMIIYDFFFIIDLSCLFFDGRACFDR